MKFCENMHKSIHGWIYEQKILTKSLQFQIMDSSINSSLYVSNVELILQLIHNVIDSIHTSILI